MREIKFRGINAVTGKFVYGFVFKTKFESKTNKHDYTKTYILPVIDNEDIVFHYHDGMRQVDTECSVIKDETIGQYTGLKDKNGSDIYEGDICYIRNGEHLKRYVSTVMFGKYYDDLRDVTIKGNGWHLDGGDSLFDFYEIEVIGNIHENPELLEEL